MATQGEQGGYQVRFDWGEGGLRAIGGDADVVIWVDEIPAGHEPALPTGAAILVADLRHAAAAAAWTAGLQTRLGRRITIAVVAAGSARADGSPRADVEDLLAAGALVGRLAELGIDACSPEAAAAEAAHRGLARAVGHLVSASVSGREAGTTPAQHRESDADTPTLHVRHTHPDDGAGPTSGTS